MLLFAEVFCLIWNSVTAERHISVNENTTVGPYALAGTNDEPYTDRTIACVKQGHKIQPVQLSQLLRDPKSSPSPGADGVDGYRVVPRENFIIDASEFPDYVRECYTLSLTLDNIFSACQVLGYNVTRDHLRVVEGTLTDAVRAIPSALPALILPYWDKGAEARYAIPGRDGSACVFRAHGMFESSSETKSAYIAAISRSVREAKTIELLNLPGGVWRNGWYEDPVVRMSWYSDVISSLPNNELGVPQRQFEVLDGMHEYNCTKLPYGCGGGFGNWRWSSSLTQDIGWREFTAVAISNGSRFGVFSIAGTIVSTTTSQYSLDKFVSNASFAVLLVRWMAMICALWPFNTIGVASLSNAKSFHLLPFYLLARFKKSLEGFWTSGCSFEGNQRAFADAWFEIYPAIGELVLLYFCLLNMIAKLLRRRVSDVLFGPTLLFFALLHWFRYDLAESGWFEFDARVSTAVTSRELDAASIVDFFTTDLGFRINGKAKSLYFMKLGVLLLNLLPLLVFSRRVDTEEPNGRTLTEASLAIGFGGNGGLGSTTTAGAYSTVSDTETVTTVRPYELVRGGFVVVGDASTRIVTSLDDWLWLLATTPLRLVAPLAVRVLIYDVTTTTTSGDASCKTETVSTQPRLAAVADEKLARVATWKLSAHALR